jgi:membrane associated rhomboid family serine protease
MPYNDNKYYKPSSFGGFRFFPPVVKSLLIINVAVYLLMFVFGMFRYHGYAVGDYIVTYLGLMPLGHGFHIWQLLTYQFLHADFWHVFFNMVFGLWMFGMEVENIWGSKKFLYYYLFCGVAAGLSQLFFSPLFAPVMGPTIGASGAIYGIMVAFAFFFPDRYVYIYFLIPIKVKYFIIFLIALGVLSIGGPSNVAHLAHLGGALAGYLFLLYDRHHSVHFHTKRSFPSRWTSKKRTEEQPTIVDAKVFDISDSKTYEPTKHDGDDLQERIDAILDKISQSGYQSLTEEEKKILFEASKRMN